jgi:hypothetical protein
MRLALLILILPVLCLAQHPLLTGAGIDWASGLPSGTVGTPPNQITNIRYWWNFSDNPTNVNVTNWVDRIQGLVLTNNADSKRPTNSTTGVGFNGSTYLTNIANFTILVGTGATGSVWVVCSMVTSAGAFGAVIGDRTSGGNGFGESSGTQMKWFGAGGSGTICDFVSGTTIRDVGIVITNTTSGQMLFWTNNVFINTAGIGAGDTTNPQKWVGCAESSGNPASFSKVKILDLAFFYGKLTTTDLTGLHKWATNQYGFSP